MKKIFSILAASIFITSLAHAAAPPTVVYAYGFVDQGVGDEQSKAKADALKDAERQCGSANILLAENLGWEVRENKEQTCTPHHFCSPEPASVSVKGVFICLDNLPKL